MPYTHYLIPTDRRFRCPSQLVWAVSRLYGHIGGVAVRFYAAKNAKNCLLGFAGQRPYIIASVAIEGTPRAPVDTLRNNMPSTPHGKADRRTSGCPAGYRGYFWGVLPRPPPPPPAPPRRLKLAPYARGGDSMAPGWAGRAPLAITKNRLLAWVGP